MKRLTATVRFALLLLAAGVPLACSALSQEIAIQAEGRLVPGRDGYPLSAYELLMEHATASRPAPRAFLFYIQGSEIVSVVSSIEHLAGAAAAGARVVLMERRGIGFKGAIDRAVAIAGSTRLQRVADHRAVIESFLRGIPAGAPVILVGASEGGDVAARIAAEEARITHVVLVGCGGGWSQAQEFRFEIDRRGRALDLASRDALDERLREIRSRPDSLEMWAGHPYRRWSSFLWTPPVDDLVRVTAPILLVHGVEDRNVPVESARALVDAFWARGKQNLTYREYPGLDHGLIDVSNHVSGFPRIEVDVIAWLAQTGFLSPKEADVLMARVRSAHREVFDQQSRPSK